ncbi:MAG: 2-C-methyl-D-erythritol 4-phosphate cytidylyltransferase, partial [Erysipelotrichaceae bacterium]|nr:2-C-methyl-D-erythritol 4-phosphate cytidylyltransferase [Erysipelotrichaceae bacterium]
KEALEEVKEKLGECDAVILGKKSRDTVKIINGDRVLSTVDRDIIFLTETPQAFRSKLIKDCYARWDGRRFTDDASLLESQGIPVSVVFDRYDNTKLTSEEDFEDI